MGADAGDRGEISVKFQASLSDDGVSTGFSVLTLYRFA